MMTGDRMDRRVLVAVLLTSDLTPYRTFKGLNLWTEHAARRLDAPALRWLAIVGLLAVGYLAVQVGRAVRRADL